MALVESGSAEIGIRRAFSGEWIKSHGRTDAEQDERAGAKLADDLKLEIPKTWAGRALAGQMGMLHRLGLSKQEVREFAAKRIEELQPEKRPDPVFKSERKPGSEDERAALEAMGTSDHTSPGVRDLVNDELHGKKRKGKKALAKKTPTRKQRLTAMARQLPRYKRDG